MRTIAFTSLAAALGVAVVSAAACGGNPRDAFHEFPTLPSDADASTAGDDATTPAFDEDAGLPSFGEAAPPCVGLGCKRVACSGGVKTTLGGTVYDPAGRVPLYNAIVYVPNAAVDPFPTGATCDKCGALASGSPLVTALTDAKGHFVLDDVPVMNDLPLVIQVGRWRRQVTIPSVTACQDNAVTDKNLTRLPRNHVEGDIPQIALTLGGCDPLECLLRKIGIDDAEFTPPTGAGRIHLYQGAGASTTYPDAQTLWGGAVAGAGGLATLSKYDMAVLACECAEHAENKPPAAIDAMHAYASAGGRIFGSHYHYYWFKDGPADFAGTANWSSTLPVFGTSFDVDTTFPKGQAFADWLSNVGATPTTGVIDLNSVAEDVGTVNASAQRWIYLPPTKSTVESDKYFTFNTPIGAKPEDQCGRVVFSDLHVASSDPLGLGTDDEAGLDFPQGCHTTELSPQEKALEFLFFDLSACVQNDAVPPTPPTPK